MATGIGSKCFDVKLTKYMFKIVNIKLIKLVLLSENLDEPQDGEGSLPKNVNRYVMSDLLRIWLQILSAEPPSQIVHYFHELRAMRFPSESRKTAMWPMSSDISVFWN
jgi:hypothetical protein